MTQTNEEIRAEAIDAMEMTIEAFSDVLADQDNILVSHHVNNMLVMTQGYLRDLANPKINVDHLMIPKDQAQEPKTIGEIADRHGGLQVDEEDQAQGLRDTFLPKGAPHQGEKDGLLCTHCGENMGTGNNAGMYLYCSTECLEAD